jgi:hypothetical protein
VVSGRTGYKKGRDARKGEKEEIQRRRDRRKEEINKRKR